MGYQHIIELFPTDVFNIILLYTNKKTIIQLHEYFPNLLKYILIYERDLDSINENNLDYIRTLFEARFARQAELA
jgi:hypothetical protein